MPLSQRVPIFLLLVVLGVSSACGLWTGADGDAALDSTAVAVDTVQLDSAAAVPTDTTTANAATATAAVTAAVTAATLPEANQTQSTPALTVDERIERLLIAQEGLSRRVDSLTTLLGGGDSTVDSAGGAGDTQVVLGEARDQVQNFGVGILWSILIIVLFNLLVRSLSWVLDQLSERSVSRRLFYKRLVPIVRIVLWVFAAWLIIRVVFQVDAQALFAAAAAVGVAIGFAAQDLLKNLFGGLILVFDQPFQVGDKIRVGGTYGEVVSIGLRSTRIVTPDDNLVSVPNAEVVDQQVANANAGELNCQVVTDLYLPGWVDEARAKRIAFEAASGSKFVYLNKPIVVLVKDEFKETFLTRVRVKAYVLDPRFEFQFESDVTERARAGFREAGLLRPEHGLRAFLDLSQVSTAGIGASQSEGTENG